MAALGTVGATVALRQPPGSGNANVRWRQNSMPSFQWQSSIAVPVDELADWHLRPGSFERLRPPWRRVRVLQRSGDLTQSSRLVSSVSVGPARTRWVSEIIEYVPRNRLVDIQVKGPFARWRHTHTFEPEDAGSRLLDHIDYELPLGVAGELAGGPAVHRELVRLFRFRHRRTADDLSVHAEYRHRPRLTVAISGASGLLGSELAAFLSSGGHRVLKLVRHAPASPEEVFWDPDRAAIDPGLLAGVDAVVHLAGHSINAGRWTPPVKEAILTSRRQGTGLIARAVAQSSPLPVLISQSAVGYYGDRGAEGLEESSAPGEDFLARVAREWEDATQPARQAGARVVTLRTGLVLSGQGGALARMLPAYRFGVGGVVGRGDQWMSWISMQDWLGIVLALLYDDTIDGPVNAVSPQAVTNRVFVRTLTKVLRRPSLIPVTGTQVRLLFGEMGERLLLDSQRVVPARLQAKGFTFRYPNLEDALRAELGLLGG
jgi:uncharacterized protein (TIGR01777 family)